MTAFVERDDLQPFRARVQPVDVTVGPVDGQGLGVGQAGVNDDILKLIKLNKYQIENCNSRAKKNWLNNLFRLPESTINVV